MCVCFTNFIHFLNKHQLSFHSVLGHDLYVDYSNKQNREPLQVLLWGVKQIERIEGGREGL